MPNDPPAQSAARQFLIVGLGASAGGIPAFEGFFKHVPRDSGMAFVVVTHLSPDRESLLHEVIGRFTTMAVVVAQDGTEVVPGHVYVLPQNAILGIEQGRLRVRRPNELQRQRKPVDIFFAELAKDQGEHAVGIVLSGGDADGTLGIKAIKERGGLTLAQVADGSGPRNPGMPESAIASGFVDFAVPVEDMGAKLVEYRQGFAALDALTRSVEVGPGDGARRTQEQIYRLLRERVGHDFSGYKTKTFLRRVHRRMQVLQAQSLEEYLGELQRDPQEVVRLFRDLLINVTNFFRDADAFQVLEKLVLPRLFEGRGANDTVRIWVPGCATGEEVYSLAILLCEEAERRPAKPRVQIFATDIDEPALAVARSGRYPAPLLDGVSLERRQRYFASEGSSFVVRKEIRDLCIFSSHSVIRDPPFSRMDLVSCRNLLIYLGPEIQSQVVPIFHYALRPGGYLFLGTSESISQHGDLFASLDKKNRVFQSREHAYPPGRLPQMLARQERSPASADHRPPAGIASPYPLRQMTEAHVLERFAPPHVLVNAEGEVVYYSARTGPFLEAPQGQPNRQLLSMARKGLRLDLRAALREAIETRRTVQRDNVEVETDEADRLQAIDLTVEPLPDRADGEPLYLVLFAPRGPVRSRSDASRARRQDGAGALESVELELRDTRERLQSTVEEYETALEELKSSNEELVSVNEESQSTNEELEASKEEMQSLNEELNTINAELNSKVEELDRANNDLKNLFASTRIATVFLDRALVIRNFTPAASDFFRLRASDVGRPLTDLATHLDYPGLKDHIAGVFEDGGPYEHRLTRDQHGRSFLVRLIPYRNGDESIEGVVVTFVDVTTLAEAEEHQRTLIAELNHRVKNMLAVVASVAQQTFRQAATAESYHSALMGRLQSMGRAYGLLTRENWTEVLLDELLRQELAVFGLERVSIEGPEVGLAPQEGLSLGMMIHELVTNATKYGAYSVPDGRVEVRWERAADGRITLSWQEVGGPAARAPAEKGFGLTLLEMEASYRLGGEAKIEFRPEGLRAVIEMPRTSEGPQS